MAEDNETAGGGAPHHGHRTHGGGWIAGGIVALFVGWWLALASILSTAGPWSGRWSDGGMMLAYVIAAALGFGVPLWGFVSLRREARGGRSVSLVGPTVCLLLMALGGVTLLPLPFVQGVSLASDAAERAQPPTDGETARTIPEAQEELRVLGDRVVASMGRDSSAPAADVETDSCRLDNHDVGTMVRYSWWYDGGSTAASPSPSGAGSDAEGTRMSEPALRLLRDEGYELYQRYDGGGGYLFVPDDWHGRATIGQRAEDVLLESGCLVDPNAVDEE
ncbi:hypothetical protein [Curtobacterium sp. MCPF17_046]|uniref:hypothetical protein n=1 Tax=Curtobacterium sp. MCPF17_046 TaxID=2175663 RepID=UPI000D9EB64D|nr:hypothetical protein [Curtobacterium sp. MCPF17_046]PYY35010.1 hypothetical protein DEJ32_14370 [Curtobacterium sp. MCPF17_046]